MTARSEERPADGAGGAPPGAATVVDDGRTPTGYRLRWAVLGVVLLADVVDLVDVTIANLAGPSIRVDLGGTEAALQWVLAAYTLAFAVGLVISGRAGDIVGRKRLFLIGMCGFTAASLLCAVSATPLMLILMRALQGGFGAVMIPQGFAMVKASFPPEDLHKAFIPFGPAMGLAAVIAPILGGILIGSDIAGLGWRWVFLINLPVGLLGLLLGYRVLPELGPRKAGGRLDPVGAALLISASGLLIYPLIQGRESGWPIWAFGMILAAAVLFGLFALRERTSRSPIIPPSLLRNRSYLCGVAVITAFFAAVSALMLLVNLFVQLGLGYEPMQAGLAMIPLAVGISIGAGVSGGVLGPRLGRTALFIGVALCVLGVAVLYVSLTLHRMDVTIWQLVPGLVLAGAGMGTVFAPLFDIIVASLDDEQVGVGSGLLNAAQQFASAVGVAILGTVFFAAVGPAGFDGALRRVLIMSAVAFALTAAILPTLPARTRDGVSAR